SNDGKLGKYDVNNAATEFACSRYQILRVWKRYKQQKKADGVDIDLRNRRFQNSGRKGIDTEKILEILETVPLKNRTTQRALANEVGLAQQGLQQNLKKLGLRAASRFLKPLLTEAGKQRRLSWALSFVRTGQGGTRKFDPMDNIVVGAEWCLPLCCVVFGGKTTAVEGVPAAVTVLVCLSRGARLHISSVNGEC
ncbi:unnamed protein product, partial [Laminaria digitata]